MISQRPRSPLAVSDEEQKSPYRRTTNDRQEWDLPITKLDQKKHTSTLSALNIPRTDFLKALNFERFSARSRLLSDEVSKSEAKIQTNLDIEEESEEEFDEVLEVVEDQDEELDGEDESGEVGDDKKSDHVDDQNDDGSEDEEEAEEEETTEEDDHDSDIENRSLSEDPFEVSQADLLAKFKTLRDFQLQEQQRLMLEQQTQLEKLREEQLRVQDFLMRQQIAALSPKKTPSRNTSMNDSLIKIKLINSPAKQREIAAPNESNFDYNHNITDETTEENGDRLASDYEEVDEDYLQCSMVETEAEAHINHVEDLLRNSRDLFAKEVVAVEEHAEEFSEEDVDTRSLSEATSSDMPSANRHSILDKTPASEIVNLDEKPVSGAKKTFEELLEDKLRFEDGRKTTPASVPSTGAGVKKRPFLRRGQGTARFGTTPSPLVARKAASKTLKFLAASTGQARPVPAEEVVLRLRRPTVKKPSPVKQDIVPAERSNKRNSFDSSPGSAKRLNLVDVDLEDIEEFAMLEKYADDDYSFTSNCSIIKPRPAKMKKYVLGFGDLSEENSEELAERVERKAESPEKPSSLSLEPSSSTPRRLKRKIASKVGPTTTVEKDVLVEDYSPSVGIVNDRVERNDDGDDLGEIFDDYETWATTIPRPNFTRAAQRPTAVDDSDTPPTSKLVARLFPSLKPNPKVENKPNPSHPLSGVEGVMSKALKDKLVELEAEIDKFRKENSALAKIKKERLEALEELKNEVEQFELKKKAEIQGINEMREAELKKIKNERKLFEKYQKEMRAIPDKNQRREIEDLKSEIAELKDEMRHKETRWSSSTNRMRNRIEALEKENAELQDEIKLMEKQRLELWQKEIALKNEKKKKTQHGPLQQQNAHESTENNATEALRLQFDKLLRASLDDIHVVPEENMKSEIPPTGKSKLTEERPLQIAKNTDSHPRQETVVKSQPLTTTNGPKANFKPIANRLNKAEVKIDTGNGNYREIRHKDGKTERTFENGSKEVVFANGSRKQISADGESVIVSFFNGDVKQILPDQRVVYYYADSKTKHTTFPDGIEVLEFPNQQVEKHYPNGTREIVFPDKTIRYLYPTGAEESVFVDGTIVKIDKNGDRVMEFPNGQKEIHTKDFKRREYPDGTTKTVYPDGRQETKYSSGRFRVKDGEGNILVDQLH